MKLRLLLSVYRGLSGQVRYNITCPCPPFNPDAQTPSWLLQVELHALQLLIDTEGTTPSSSHLSVLPEEPGPLHSHPPVTGAVPPQLPDAKEITALQVCTHL